LAQFASALAVARPHADVSCTYLDLFRATLALEYCSVRPSNLRIDCAADLPNDEADVVALPFSASGEAELTRDLIQAGHQRLRIGGRMFATTDNPNDTWLRDQLNKVFGKLEQQHAAAGTLYVGIKTEPLKKFKKMDCEFAFRDRGRLIRAYSRPAVFSHRKIDTGARRLIDAMQIEPGMRILDIGCGSGTVAIAAACRCEDVTVHAVDSNARAVECAMRGAELNGLGNLTTELNAAGGYDGAGTYDLALANPPYYSGYRIAVHFLSAGRDALHVGGKILVVTKLPDWYRENMPKWFEGMTVAERKGYFLLEGVRPQD
jgi:16S rRNA (guanine1207-N2)-methyltransferase